MVKTSIPDEGDRPNHLAMQMTLMNNFQIRLRKLCKVIMMSAKQNFDKYGKLGMVNKSFALVFKE